MPARGKRVFEDFDPNKSDSADSTYDATTSRPPRNKSSRSHRGKPSRKRQRRSYGVDGSDDISDGSDLTAESFQHDTEEEEPEIDDRTGRPKRKSAKKRPTYQESDGDSEIVHESSPSSAEEDPPSRNKRKKTLLIKLNVPNQTHGSNRRSTRARSSSLGAAHQTNMEFALGITRRSSRIAHDESETMVALTDSGNHANIVRPGTHSPDDIPQRVLRGGKGIRGPAGDMIMEESSNSSTRAKEEPLGCTDEQDILSFDPEIAASREDLTEYDPVEVQQKTETQNATQGDPGYSGDIAMDETAVVPESSDELYPHTNAANADDDEDDDDDDDDEPIRKSRPAARQRSDNASNENTDAQSAREGGRTLRRKLRSSGAVGKTRSSQRSRRGVNEESSDFEPPIEEGPEEDISDSEVPATSPRKRDSQRQVEDDENSNSHESSRLGKRRVRPRRGSPSDERDSEVADELAEELQDLRNSRPRRGARSEILYDAKPQTRKRKPVDYRILPPDLTMPVEEDADPTATPSKRGRGAGNGAAWQRSLFSTYGPFGGAGGPTPLFGGPGGAGATGGVDSDSSDDENMQRPRAPGIGGQLGMTPTSAVPPVLSLLNPPQSHTVDHLQAPSGTPANLGKVRDKQALADADPLGVDQNVNFDSVGGLQGHVDQLKEMVALPLLYPEVFQRFHVTPPQGVLFHGPPGTGKTLLARALASSVSSHGRKVTFYMRKGADALSKWVGEAERQLRLLFEEARNTQPSIIFFDEIDGLAPVRSSKQEQIHASIVSTLLALMDGMDGRGQVIVIGATNRPDSIDPALRRPGRFDREFYFPLPSRDARRSILDIHTKGWDPPVASTLKDELAEVTKGYGGADLRALCTEAALNAVQRTYPQIYRSNEKLQISPETIKITSKDFMISVKKIIPSSERSATSGAAPLPKRIEPLLRHPLADVKDLVAKILPQKRRLTALEEAEFEDALYDQGLGKERMQQDFEESRVFRPRLLIRGPEGMGQQYLAAALLNHFEGLHVQSFDLPTLLSDSARSSEAAIVQLFAEVRRHKPSVIYIPNVDIWYRTMSETVIKTFLGLLRGLPPTDPILLLGMLDSGDDQVDPHMVKDMFGFAKRDQYELSKPRSLWRREFLQPIIEHLHRSPTEFPEPANRKRRSIETLPPVPPEQPKAPEPPTKEQVKAQKRKDRLTLNLLKLRIQPIMDQIRTKNKKFRTGVIDEAQIRYLYEEEDTSMVTTDLPQGMRQAARFRPYEKGIDDRGEPGLVEQASGKFYYNMETVTIEKRLSNGYYKRPKDFLADVKKLAKDAKAIGDQERLLKANELLANVEVDLGIIEAENPSLAAEFEAVFIREQRRENEMIDKAQSLARTEGRNLELGPLNIPPNDSGTTFEQSSGPIVLGQPMTNGITHRPITPSRPSQHSTLTNGYSGGISDLSDLHGPPSESNGTSVPSRTQDAHMTNSEDAPSAPSADRETQSSSFGPSAQTRPLHSYTGGPASLQQRLSLPGSLSQRSAITPMAEGTIPGDYTNDASTTSSDKRVSGSSGPFNTQNTATQSSKGNYEGPDLSILPEIAPANSQLPDTQSSSQPQSSQSKPQVPEVPAFSRSHGSIRNILNDTPPNSAVPPPSTDMVPSNPVLVADIVAFEELLQMMVTATSPCTVEQLEQIYSTLMSEIWDTRGEWNRVRVATVVRARFLDVLQDINDCQDVGPSSMGEYSY